MSHVCHIGSETVPDRGRRPGGRQKVQGAAGLWRGCHSGGGNISVGVGDGRARTDDPAQVSGCGYNGARLDAGDCGDKRAGGQRQNCRCMPQPRDSGQCGRLSGGMYVLFSGLLRDGQCRGGNFVFRLFACAVGGAAQTTGKSVAGMDQYGQKGRRRKWTG